MMPERTSGLSDHKLQAGQAALQSGVWHEARACFEAALLDARTPEALEGLGLAAWWLDDAAVTFDARVAAYQLYRRRGDSRSAARVAAQLAIDHLYARGERAIASGWVRRARRLLQGSQPGVEHGWLDVVEAQIVMWTDHDFTSAQRLCAEAAELGRLAGDVNLEMLALASEGLCMVSQGLISEGMRCLDEATLAAMTGEMTDLDASCTTCCFLIYACEWTRDLERAVQWVERLSQVARRAQHPRFFSFCRVHYASLLVWRGAWVEAEAELTAAVSALEATQPAIAAEAVVRLAELFCRLGRFEEAAALLARAEAPPMKALAGDLSLTGRASLALAQGEPRAAADYTARFLRVVPKEDRMERLAALELAVQALLASGQLKRAEAALGELQAAADAVATRPMQASACFATGLVAGAAGQHETARCCFEDAVELWSRSGAPFETAQARVELARSLLALGRSEAAAQQAREASAALQQLGAGPACARAAALLRQAEAAPQPAAQPPLPDALTLREQEVLRLLSTGKSNQEIAVALVLSVRTVERHISNIYQKIGVSGPVARAAAIAYAIRHDLLAPPC